MSLWRMCPVYTEKTVPGVDKKVERFLQVSSTDQGINRTFVSTLERCTADSPYAFEISFEGFQSLGRGVRRQGGGVLCAWRLGFSSPGRGQSPAH